MPMVNHVRLHLLSTKHNEVAMFGPREADSSDWISIMPNEAGHWIIVEPSETKGKRTITNQIAV